MNTFLIDSENAVTAHLSKAARKRRDGIQFGTAKELESVSSDWALTRLAAIWNKLPGAKPVRKFTNRDIAIRRIWTAIQAMAPKTPSTKTEAIVALLKRPSGATLQDLMDATEWQAHSVRGFISGHLSKRLGLRVTSVKGEGVRVYRIR